LPCAVGRGAIHTAATRGESQYLITNTAAQQVKARVATATRGEKQLQQQLVVAAATGGEKQLQQQLEARSLAKVVFLILYFHICLL